MTPARNPTAFAKGEPNTMEPTIPHPDASARLEEFRSEVERLKIRGSSPGSERRLLLAGALLMPVGLVVVLVGWLGASGTDDFLDQIPFLISGGVLGLGLIIAGAALFLRYSLGRYLRYWLMRLIFEERISADRSVDALERIAALLADGSAGGRAPTSTHESSDPITNHPVVH